MVEHCLTFHLSQHVQLLLRMERTSSQMPCRIISINAQYRWYTEITVVATQPFFASVSGHFDF